MRLEALTLSLLGCSGSLAAPLLGTSHDSGVEADAPIDAGTLLDVGTSDEAAVEAGPDGCAVIHWSGFGMFLSCIPVGQYDAELALEACRSATGDAGGPSGCAVRSPNDAGWCAGENEVGVLADPSTIMWSWTADAGYGLVSASPLVPECANDGAGKPYWSWW